MAEDTYSFATARARLEEIVTQVRRKDVSLEQSLDLLEEGVRLANSCTELIDHTEWRSAAAEAIAEDEVRPSAGDAGDAGDDDAAAEEGDAPGDPEASESEAPADSPDEAETADGADPADEAWADKE